ncbi:MAG: DUF2752 domain-containing protein [Verrucomicrobiales bacterium]|nr:DUF2752 domain-containing protein [Verrucomicrobiales bacterium]
MPDLPARPPVLSPRERRRTPGALGGRRLAGVLLLALLAGLLVAHQAVRAEWPLPQCDFLRLTGHPCPFCGTTRSLAALGGGEFGAAFRWNPLVVVTLAVFTLWALTRLVGIRWTWSGSPRFGWLMLLFLVILNWLWQLTSFPGG